MTKATAQIRTEPDGNPAVGVQTRVLKLSDNTPLDTKPSDSNGIVTFEWNGSPGPITLRIEGRPGGDRSLASGEAMTSGVFSPAELPAALSVLGDGVLRGYLNEMAVSVVGETLTVSTGGALVSGYPVMFASSPAFSVNLFAERPEESTRVDRVVVYVEPPTGTAGIARLVGTEGLIDAPALTQTAARYEIALARIVVPPVDTLTVYADDRIYSGDRLDAVATNRVPSATTTSVPGAAIADLEVTLTLPRAVTYDIEAEITGQQVGVTPVSAWALQATYDPVWSLKELSNPGQIAIDSAGRVLIADTGQDRLLILNSSGVATGAITGLTGITGVCVDASDNIYVTYGSTMRKYLSTLGTPVWTQVLVPMRHCATDGTTVFATRTDHRFIGVRASDGASTTSYGSSGSGDGQFNTPWGIAYGTHFGTPTLYVVDQGNSRVQRFTTAGGYVAQWAIGAGARGITQLGTLWVAEHGENRVRHYDGFGAVVNSFSQASPSGIVATTGNVVWVSNATAGTIAKWDEATTPGGYGQIAVELDGTVSAYTGIGQRVGAVANSTTGTKTGPGSVLVRGFAKSTLNTTSLSGLTLSARATPRG